MAAYMEFSFTGEAARDRYCGDHSSHTLIRGGASSRIPRALNITPSSEATPSGAKRSFADGMWAAAPQERVRCCSGDAGDLRPPAPIRRDKLTPARDCFAFCRIGSSETRRYEFAAALLAKD